MRVVVATDTWHPHINGVVHTLDELARAAPSFGASIAFLTPEGLPSVPLPTYPGLRLPFARRRTIARQIVELRPAAIHIATEGPIGFLVRQYCRANRLAFTTSFHTRFPEYVAARTPIPESWTWAALRWFHRPAGGVMAATAALEAELVSRGFANVMPWPRGVDATLFRPLLGADLGVPRPVFLTVGRLAVEKNIDAFLALDLPGTKVVVGDGPARADLTRRFPDAVFLGVHRAKNWRAPTQPPTCSCFRAAPTLMVSYCSKRSRAGSRSLRFRCADRAMWWATRRWRRSIRTCVPPVSTRSRSRANNAAPLRSNEAGMRAPASSSPMCDAWEWPRPSPPVRPARR
jgi:Glycosyltransferase Family 4